MNAMRWAKLAASIARSTGSAKRDRYLEKNEKDLSLVTAPLGNQNQLSTAQAAKSEPTVTKEIRQPPRSAAKATKGTPITEDNVVNAIRPPTIFARRA